MGERNSRHCSSCQTHQQQRNEWLALADHLTPLIEGVERELKSLAEQNSHVTRLITHPGIGTLTGLALVHTLGLVERFATARKVTAYAGLDPLEHPSGERQRIGSISKQGSKLLRYLMVEAGHIASRHDPI
jgi:transposase